MSKRGHDAGTIYDRKNRLGKVISYQAQLSLPGGDRRTKTFKTRREAQRWLTETQAAVLHGHLLPSRSQRLSEYLEGWLETKRQTIKPLTYNAYDLNVRRIQPHLGHIRLDALKPAHVQDAYNQLSAKGMAPRTVRQVHLTLHKALKDAIQLDLIGRNVTEGVMLPRLPHSERPW